MISLAAMPPNSATGEPTFLWSVCTKISPESTVSSVPFERPPQGHKLLLNPPVCILLTATSLSFELAP